jgi:adenylate cyclase
VAAQMATGKLPPRNQFHGRGAWIDFHDTKTLQFISFLDVINAHGPLPIFSNKIVVVGAFAPSLGDVHSTPVGQMAGANILGEAVSTILRDFPLRDSAGFIGILLVLAFAFIPPVGGLRLRPVWGLATAVLLAVLYLVAAQLLFLAGYVIPVIAPLVALMFAAVGTLFITGLVAGYERRRVRDVFSRFVDERVVNQVLEQAGGELRLGGESRECTVLFSDLRGFTTYSEGRQPAEVIDILNSYTEEMSQAILNHEGTLLSYLGDGIFALFGAPLEQPDHRDRAVATARDMITRLEQFNKDQQAQGKDVDFRMGIGINTGTVMVGNVGSERRLEYTAIGDPVNTASRIEGLTKGTPHQIYLAESTYQGLTDKSADLEQIGELDIRGRTTGVKIWGVQERQERQDKTDQEKTD